MILAFASAAHGRNLLGHWYIVGIAAALYGLIGWLAGGYLAAAIAALFVPAYWLMFRRGHQARIEQDYMDTINPPHPTLHDVLKAHYYCGWLVCLSLLLFNYSTRAGKWLGWEDQWVRTSKVRGKPVRIIEITDPKTGEKQPRIHPDDKPILDCRRPTEFAAGLPGDIIILCLITLF